MVTTLSISTEHTLSVCIASAVCLLARRFLEAAHLSISTLLVGMVLGKHIYAILFVILAVVLIGGAVTFTKSLSYRYRTEPNC